MVKPTPRRYWASNCFLGWLKDEPDKVDACRAVLNRAEAGVAMIKALSLTLAEVIKVKKGTPITKRGRSTGTRLLQEQLHPGAHARPQTSRRSSGSRSWNYNIDPKDAVHVATALRSNVVRLDTFDEPLISKVKTIDRPPLKIGRPDLSEQLTFPLRLVGNDFA